MIFHAGINKTTASSRRISTAATDLNGNVLWYYDPVANNFPSYAQNIEPGGGDAAGRQCRRRRRGL